MQAYSPEDLEQMEAMMGGMGDNPYGEFGDNFGMGGGGDFEF